MTSMTVYDVEVIHKDKTIVMDTSGPYFGSFLDHDAAIKCAVEYEKDNDVFMTYIKQSSVMA